MTMKARYSSCYPRLSLTIVQTVKTRYILGSSSEKNICTSSPATSAIYKSIHCAKHKAADKYAPTHRFAFRTMTTFEVRNRSAVRKISDTSHGG